ncbi:FAD-dependent monooxygenase [Streptomyces gamaensis]|uniref:FAD-dependent monooxygenase n=1 Tax=Streptomyces gamaensis TaxID=1763542 RepID=A0ABW0YT96_9ACTN
MNTDALTDTGTVPTTPGVPMDTDVLICGAGPTGLVLAADLARRGVPHRIVERDARGFPGSRGVAIQPRSQEVFDDLGAIEALRAAGGRCPPVQIWHGPQRVRERELVVRADPTPHVPYAEPLMVPQWRTVEVLYARLEELGGDVEFGKELTGLAQDADGVTATLRHADGTTETVRARYLVGADGGRGATRGLLGVPFRRGPVHERTALIADLVMEEGSDTELDREHWHMWPESEDGFLALRRLEHTELLQMIAGVAEGEDPDAADPEEITRILRRRTGLPGPRVREVRWSSLWRAKAAMAERFREGRVFLAGDAAHIHPPSGGQGLNTSVQDAYNLGWKLGAVLRHGAPDALLDTYDSERVRVAAGILDLAHRTAGSDLAQAADGLSKRGPDTLQLGIAYPDSPLTRERRAHVPEGALRAGDRAPDAPCTDRTGRTVRLFDAFRGPHFTLLALTGAPVEAPPQEWVRTYRIGGTDPDLLDTDGYAKAAYGSGLFLIRPDGHVGLATDDPADVPDYLRAVGG